MKKFSLNLEKIQFGLSKNQFENWKMNHTTWKKTQVQNLKTLRFKTRKKLGRFQTWKNNGFENSQSFEKSIYRERLIQLLSKVKMGTPIGVKSFLKPDVTECWGDFNSKQFARQKFLQIPFLGRLWSPWRGKKIWFAVGVANEIFQKLIFP